MSRVHYADLMTLDVPEMCAEGVRVERFTVSPAQAEWEMLRAMFGGHGRGARAGTYTRLSVDGVLWMSDTPDEKRDHASPVWEAQDRGGRILVNGLGLGMVVGAMLRIPQAEHVDVVELDERIIRHIGPLYAGDRCTIHQGDALTMKWPTGTRWTVAWHDIWPTISSDNLPEMARLHRMYGHRVDWQGSWAEREARRIRGR